MKTRDSLRDNWRSEVYGHPCLGDATKVLMLLLADSGMTDRGVVSVPQKILAERLGVDVRRIKARIAVAIDVGVLQKLSGGYRTRTAEYIAVMGTAQRHPFSCRCSWPKPEKGDACLHPFSDRKTVPFPAAESALMGTAQRTPNARVTNATVPADVPGASDSRLIVAQQDGSDERVPARSRLAALSPDDDARCACGGLRVAA